MHYQRLHCVGELWSTMQGSRGLSVTPHPTPLFCDSRQQINANPHHTLWNMAVVLQKQVVRPNKIFINYLFQIFTAFFYTADRKCYCFITVCFLSFSNIFMYWRCGSTSHMELFYVCVLHCFFFFFCFILNILRKSCNLIHQWGSMRNLVSSPRREWKHDDLISSLCLSSMLLPGFYVCVKNTEPIPTPPVS